MPRDLIHYLVTLFGDLLHMRTNANTRPMSQEGVKHVEIRSTWFDLALDEKRIETYYFNLI